MAFLMSTLFFLPCWYLLLPSRVPSYAFSISLMQVVEHEKQRECKWLSIREQSAAMAAQRKSTPFFHTDYEKTKTIQSPSAKVRVRRTESHSQHTLHAHREVNSLLFTCISSTSQRGLVTAQEHAPVCSHWCCALRSKELWKCCEIGLDLRSSSYFLEATPGVECEEKFTL